MGPKSNLSPLDNLSICFSRASVILPPLAGWLTTFGPARDAGRLAALRTQFRHVASQSIFRASAPALAVQKSMNVASCSCAARLLPRVSTANCRPASHGFQSGRSRVPRCDLTRPSPVFSEGGLVSLGVWGLSFRGETTVSVVRSVLSCPSLSLEVRSFQSCPLDTSDVQWTWLTISTSAARSIWRSCLFLFRSFSLRAVPRAASCAIAAFTAAAIISALAPAATRASRTAGSIKLATPVYRERQSAPCASRALARHQPSATP